MGHLRASGPAMLECRHTERIRRPRRKDRRDRARLEGTHARDPGRYIGSDCVGAGAHACAFSCFQHSSVHPIMIGMARQMIFADLFSDRMDGALQELSFRLAEAIRSSSACTAGGPAKMLPDRSQARSL